MNQNCPRNMKMASLALYGIQSQLTMLKGIKQSTQNPNKRYIFQTGLFSSLLQSYFQSKKMMMT